MSTSKSILELNHNEIKKFFLKNSSYININLPTYFNFENLLTKISAEIGNNLDIKSFFKLDENNKRIFPKNFENVNYLFLNNKDGNYDWRLFELIHPFLYVFMVHTVSSEENWNRIKDRFNHFKNHNYITCTSIPVESKTINSDTGEQIINWWKTFELESIALGLEFDYLFETDISNCYPSIYTHSIAWAIETKDIAKSNRSNDLLGNFLDTQFQNMSYGQTNGIPQGSVLMDFIAEIVLGYGDELLTNKIIELGLDINSFKILRYRDDYRIFTKNVEIGKIILQELSNILFTLGFKLSKGKTKMSDDIIKSSIKEDKYYLIENLTYHKTLIKKIYFIKIISDKYQNSSVLIKLLEEFYKDIRRMTNINENIGVLISILVNIMFKNPRVYHLSISILSVFLDQVNSEEEKKVYIDLIIMKLKKVPNVGHLEIWLQRFTKKHSLNINYDEKLCKKVDGENVLIWNSTWLEDSIRNIIESENFINYNSEELSSIIERDEFKIFYY